MFRRSIQTIALCVFAASASAVPILDQSHVPAATTSSSAVNSAIVQAQTFNVGLSGILARIDIAGSGGGGGLMMDIRGTSGGLPNGSDVRQTVSVGALSSGYTSIALSTSVTAGELLAAVFYFSGSGSASLFGVASSVADPYAGGGLWTMGNASINSGGWYPNGNSGSSDFDLAFQTWIDDGTSVPTPAAAALLAVGLMGMRRRVR